MQNVYRFGDSLLREIRETHLEEGTVALWNLGQEGYVLKGKEQVLVIDPYLSNSIDEAVIGPQGLFVRDFPPPLDPSQMTDVHYVMCTHFHQDHLDTRTLTPLSSASPDATFIAPASHTHLLDTAGIAASRVVPARHLETLQLGEFQVTPFAECHARDEVDEAGNHFYLGYLVRVNGVTVYHSGDTIYFDDLREWLSHAQVDVALVNANGRDWMRDKNDVVGNMNYREAIEFAYAIGADMIVPMHFDMFRSNRENPAYFVDYLFSTHRDLKFHMFAVGERFVYHKSRP